ncbi:recombinase family protein [Streptomyces goshikiensis]|uniref:recombinase family protein n=1 Tax=Streptomyces goshikiensis TaxID=1942 RepID=UPI003661681B
MSSEKPRVAVYTSMAHAGNPLELHLQRAKCERWAEARGMHVTKTYESVGSMDVYLDLLGDISRGEFDAVVASDCRRYNRQSAKVEALVGMAERAGVAVHIVAGGDTNLSSAAGRVTLGLMEAEFEIGHAAAQAQERERSESDL